MKASSHKPFAGFRGFTYTPAIPLESGVSRRDPSPVIMHNGVYYVWYSKSTADPSGYAASVWYATSLDGVTWEERGEAVPKGSSGSWDEHGVFTPTLVVAEGVFYVIYTAVPEPFTNDEGGPGRTKTAIGVARARSPEGPWRRVGTGPVLVTAAEPEAYDSHRVDDACVVRRGGRYWLYFKGRQMGRTPGQTKMGVAFSDNPEGPYTRYEHNPVIGSGHEVCVWPHGDGVAALMAPVGPEGSTLQYSSDGLEFRTIMRVSPPSAPGPYREDLWQDGKGPGISWGISMAFDTETGWPYLVRFDADLRFSEE